MILTFNSTLLLAQEYQTVSSDLYPALDLYELGRGLAPHQLVELDLHRKAKLFSGSMDQIYFNPDFPSQFAILKLDLKFTGSSANLKISANEFVCHGETSRKRAFALYLKGFSESSFQKICADLNQSKPPSRTAVWMQAFVNTASASSDCTKQSPFDQARDIQESAIKSPLLQKIGTCIANSVQGAKNAFTGFADGFAALLKNPYELWGELSKQASAVLSMMTHLQSEMEQMRKNLSELDPDLLVHVACQMGGEALATVGLTGLSGVGAYKLTALLTQAAARLKNFKSIFSRLNTLTRTGKSQLAKEVLSCGLQ